MNIAVLGTGIVGETLGGKLVELGHAVKMGSRTAANEKAAAWAAAHGPGASHGAFAEAAAFGEVVINCTAGKASLEALRQAGADNLRGKILMDVANPLDYSTGALRLTVCNTDSLAEQIQRAFPDTKVVKTLNTMNCRLMVNPKLVPGDHDVFVSGDDPAAKEAVKGYLREWFGWQSIVDLGGLQTARGVEMILPLWVNLFGVMGGPAFNFKIVH